MTDYAEALDAALTARYRIAEVRSPITSRRGVQARMNALEKAHGGSHARAAASAGVPRSTWNHWRAGRPLSPASQRKLDAAYARQVIQPAVARKLATTRAPKGVEIFATVVGDPGRSRYLNSTPRRWFRPEKIAMGRVVQAWLHQGRQGAADVLNEEIKDRYPTTFGFEDDVEVQFKD